MNRNSWSRFFLLFSILFIGIFFSSCVEEKNPETAENATAAEMSESSSASYPRNIGLDNRVKQVVAYLKSEESPLYEPSSYSPIKWYAVSANADSTEFMVNHEFRAKEEDGVYRRFGKQFIMDAEGKVLSMQDPPVNQ